MLIVDLHFLPALSSAYKALQGGQKIISECAPFGLKTTN